MAEAPPRRLCFGPAGDSSQTLLAVGCLGHRGAGSMGDIRRFSLNESKVMTAGESGMVKAARNLWHVLIKLHSAH